MEKLTFTQLTDYFLDYNQQGSTERLPTNPIIKKAVIVFSADSFTEPYTVEERSYVVRSDCKEFVPGAISNSIRGDCLDGKDLGVRLDWYIGQWEVEYCYLLEAEE